MPGRASGFVLRIRGIKMKFMRWLAWVFPCAVLLRASFLFAVDESAMRLFSPVFQEKQRIPDRYTCKGEDLSPPLEWSGEPKGTRSYALIVEDPDAPAGLWVHWLLYNIPAAKHQLAEGVAKIARLADGSLQGMNDFHKTGYGGPCPPRGKPHRYVFRLIALDQPLTLEAGATREQLLASIRGHKLGEAVLIGTYSVP